MSNVLPSPDFDFWEFVCCGRCQLPFSGGNKSVPFWLTDCGHVICNNHLNSDQSCSQCGSQGILLVPLQKEMDPPMLGWFQSIPMALDTVAFAAKFQQETMGLQIRYYRARCQQQRALIDRMKKDIAEFKKYILSYILCARRSGRTKLHISMNENLLQEISQLRRFQHSQYSDQPYDRQSPSSVRNAHGKRQMGEERSHVRHQRSTNNSSPLSALGPARLTLPQGQNPPQLSSNKSHPEHGSVGYMGHSSRLENYRPSTGLIEQYAYAPPSTSRYTSQDPSRSHDVPRRFQNSNVNQEITSRQGDLQIHESRNMPPPPTPIKFKPAQVIQNSKKSSNQPPTVSTQNQGLTIPDQHGPKPSQNTGPSRIPAYTGQQQSQIPRTAQRLNTSLSHQKSHISQPMISSSRFVPATQSFVPPSTASQSQRPPPTTPLMGGPQRFLPPGSGTPSINESGRGQRVPFVPGGQRSNFM